MNIEQRIKLLVRLGSYIADDSQAWQETKLRASQENGWFIPEYINKTIQHIGNAFLQEEKLAAWVARYRLPQENSSPKRIGIVMAGNIPLVGFHDFLCCFITGNHIAIKSSARDKVLLCHLAGKLLEWAPELEQEINFSEQLKNCDAYIATGSNNTSRYFEYYFARYRHIIRKNRTSVALLDGTETWNELAALADDVMLYFGLGCRNVTQVYVPQGYDFVPMLEALDKYGSMKDHNKYKNNYDYNLALHLLNNRYYMTNGTTLLSELDSPFSPISQLNYQYYTNADDVFEKLQHSADVQAIIGHYGIPFGRAQTPALTDYADGVDTMLWLTELANPEVEKVINPVSSRK